MFEQLIVFMILLIFGIYNALNSVPNTNTSPTTLYKNENMTVVKKSKSIKSVNFSPQVDERVFSKKTGNILANDVVKINDR